MSATAATATRSDVQRFAERVGLVLDRLVDVMPHGDDRTRLEELRDEACDLAAGVRRTADVEAALEGVGEELRRA